MLWGQLLQLLLLLPLLWSLKPQHSPLQEQHSPERGSSVSGGLPALPPSPTLVCKARGVFVEEKTLL